MHINGIPMLITISRNLKFGTVEAQPNRKETTLVHGLVSIVKVYRQRGFQVTVALMDGEFDTVGIREGLAAEQVAVNYLVIPA